MIYSVVPFGQIFSNPEENIGMRMEVSLQGEQVILLKNENNTYTLERLISTDPKAYLKPEFMPGTILMAITQQKPGEKWEIQNLV